MVMESSRKIKCKSCGKEFMQPYNPQGGGLTKIYCSAKCRSRQWARDNKDKIKIAQDKYEAKPESKFKKKTRSMKNNKDAWVRRTPQWKLFNNAKARAREKKIEFTIRLEDIKIPEVCPLLGLSFNIGRHKCQGDSPSLDRIDPKKGYTPDNIWVISHKANSAKNDLSLNELKMLVENFEQKLVGQKIHETRKS